MRLNKNIIFVFIFFFILSIELKAADSPANAANKNQKKTTVKKKISKSKNKTNKSTKKISKKIIKPETRTVDISSDSTTKTTMKTGSAEDMKSNSEKYKRKQFIKILIDPGHGGMDSGGTIEGVEEKNIVLKLAQLTAAELNSEKYKNRFITELTRVNDVFITLKNRKKKLKTSNADIFISIHLNLSVKNPDASGTELYFVSEAGAPDIETERIAEIENSSPEYAGENEELESDNGILSYVLADLNKRNIINQSVQLALNLEKNIKKLDGIRVRHIKRAPFFVLKTLSAPAVLIEAGFLTNENDRNLFQSEEFLNSYAVKIAGGINSFYENTIKKIEFPYVENVGDSGLTNADSESKK